MKWSVKAVFAIVLSRLGIWQAMQPVVGLTGHEVGRPASAALAAPPLPVTVVPSREWHCRQRDSYHSEDVSALRWGLWQFTQLSFISLSM